jgi:Domain of unknown function (DUF4184)
MPFPLAHPAAVLPLRRFCPRWLNFPALVIGSLISDAGYLSGHLRWDRLSHRFLAGSFGFCLPVGLLALLVFYGIRTPVVRMLPGWCRRSFLPLCGRHAGSPLPLVASVLIGAWTHIFLDSVTHEDGWFERRLPCLLRPLYGVGHGSFRVCDLLYAGATFAGVVWVAFCYLRWLENVARPPTLVSPTVKWTCSFLLGISVLSIALASRGDHPAVGLVPAGLVTMLLVIAFLGVSGWHIASRA